MLLLLFLSHLYVSGSGGGKVKLLAGSPSLSVSLLFVSTSLVLPPLLSFFLSCLLHILFILQSFRLLFSSFFLSVLQLKPVDTAELSCLPSLHPSPSPYPELTGPGAAVRACGSLPLRLVRTRTLSLSLSLSGWDDVGYSIRSYIFCTTPLSVLFALLFCDFVQLYLLFCPSFLQLISFSVL